METPGANASLLLVVSTPLAIALAHCVAGQLSMNLSSPAARRYFVHALATGLVACVFWGWAMKKVLLFGDPDLGAVSFPAWVAASWNGARSALSLGTTLAELVCQRRALLGASALLVANYGLAALLIPALPGTFRAYLCLGAAYWAAAGFLGLRLLGALRERVCYGVNDGVSDVA